ncbi:hypothetical protein ACQEVZ_60570, partial [Dactylosporangium sp. CA-152071]|uniref:hypothetical protein n=1 Tax=Dactylosporangium sp. CA-152071 TaxID=3239933 RepID=UPI003D8D6F66
VFADTTLPQMPYAWVWGRVRRIDRIPEDLPDLAAEWGISVADLLAVASASFSDPALIYPLLAAYNPDVGITSQQRRWRQWMKEKADSVGVAEGYLLGVLNDARISVNWSGTTDELRRIVESWRATAAGLGPAGFSGVAAAAVVLGDDGVRDPR